MFRGSARGASTVVGALLLVGVVVIVGGVVALGALTFLDGAGAPQATATFDYEETPAGLRMTPNAISATVTVQLNGRDVATFEPESAGQSVLLPTAPGDRITVVSRGGEQSVLVDRTVDDRSEIGDFIAYYRFDSGGGDTLVDRSGNGNDAKLNNNGETDSWSESSYQFDGDSYFQVQSLQTPVSEVSEFTIAVAYRTETGNKKQELVEHINNNKKDNWGLEIKPCEPWSSCTSSSKDTTYKPNFFVDEEGGSQTGQIFTAERTTGEREVIVGTYNQESETAAVYIDGMVQENRSFDSTVDMGNFYIGADAEGSNGDKLEGEIYEIRLYYTAFDSEEIKTVTKAME